MPGITGIEFAQSIPVNTLIVFTTAYAEYALDSYEVSAIDYLVKPIEMNRFLKAVNKAIAYHKLLLSETAEKSGGDTGRIYLHQIGTTLYQDKLQ